jgi:hypothetical protein
VQTLSAILDAQSLADSGLDGGTTETPDLVGAPGVAPGNPNLRVFTVAGVAVPLELLRGRLAAFYAAPGNVIGGTDFAPCIGGANALGLELTFQKGAEYFQVEAVLRNGTLYLIEWLAPATPPASRATDVLAEVERTWQWLDTANATANPTVATQPPGTQATVPPATAVAHQQPSAARGASPAPTLLAIGFLMTATVSVTSLGDRAVDVSVSIVDPSSGKPSALTTLTLDAFGRVSQPVPKGDYVITFQRQGDVKPLTCSFHVNDHDRYQFVTTDANALVLRNDEIPASAADQLVATSALCKAKAG